MVLTLEFRSQGPSKNISSVHSWMLFHHCTSPHWSWKHCSINHSFTTKSWSFPLQNFAPQMNYGDHSKSSGPAVPGPMVRQFYPLPAWPPSGLLSNKNRQLSLLNMQKGSFEWNMKYFSDSTDCCTASLCSVVFFVAQSITCCVMSLISQTNKENLMTFFSHLQKQGLMGIRGPPGPTGSSVSISWQ